MLRFILITTICIAFESQSKTRIIGILEALSQKKVKAEAFSLGGHMGYCAKIKIQNLTGDSLIVLIESGLKLNSVENSTQDLLVVKSIFIRLAKNETKTEKVKGYCCQASNRSPFENAKYSILKTNDTNLIQLAKYLDHNEFQSGLEQSAVWALSNNRPTASIASSDDTCSILLRTFVSKVKHEPLPWYSVESSTFQYTNGLIEIVPLVLKGKVNFTLEEDCYSEFLICNEEGLPVAFIKQEWLRRSINYEYLINVSVKGLDKGKYYIQLLGKQKAIFKHQFEI